MLSNLLTPSHFISESGGYRKPLLNIVIYFLIVIYIDFAIFMADADNPLKNLYPENMFVPDKVWCVHLNTNFQHILWNTKFSGLGFVNNAILRLVS